MSHSDTEGLGLAAVAELGGCRRAGSACKHSWAAAVVLARDMAGEERDSSFGGHGQGAGPIASLVATSGVAAAAKARDAGSHLVSAARQRA